MPDVPPLQNDRLPGTAVIFSYILIIPQALGSDTARTRTTAPRAFVDAVRGRSEGVIATTEH